MMLKQSRLSLLLLLVAVWTLVANAFVPSPYLAKTGSASQQLFVASQPLPQDEGTPATVFGRPVGDGAKKFNKEAVHFIKHYVFDNIYAEDSVECAFARFWALEEIARMPYAAYLMALHLYETAGLWRKSDYLKIHFAETWNEQHHLLIMEELGGNQRWFDRFFAQHIALGYFAMALTFYFVNPAYAYNFNQHVEEEAFESYSRFLEKQGEFLKTQPAPLVAQEYYRDGDLYMFDNMSVDAGHVKARRPKMNTLYDCFSAIRDDEAEHVKTMIYMQGNQNQQ